MDHGYDKITQFGVRTQETYFTDMRRRKLYFEMFKVAMRIILDLARRATWI